MLLYLCPNCGKWHCFFSLAEVLKFNQLKQLDVVPCPAGCGLMTRVGIDDKLMIKSTDAILA